MKRAFEKAVKAGLALSLVAFQISFLAYTAYDNFYAASAQIGTPEPVGSSSGLKMPSMKEVSPAETAAQGDKPQSPKATDERCLSAGINDAELCEEYLRLPQSCADAGLTTKWQCERFLSQPAECQALKLDFSECEEYAALPAECRSAGVTSLSECQKQIFRSVMPISCREKGLDSQAACLESVLSANLPASCAALGATNSAACIEAEKGSGNNIQICRNAGVKNEKCDEYVAETEKAQICRRLEIIDQAQCDYYHENLFYQRFCSELGAKDPYDCEERMFERYGGDICAGAGITEDKECRAYLVNRHMPSLDCGGLSEWDCLRQISEGPYGQLAYKQSAFDQLQKIVFGAERIASSGQLKNAWTIGSEIFPLASDSVGIKTVESVRALKFKGKELVQSSPAILVFDADQDGLPDDAEAAIGSGPEQADSDRDGVSDGDEAARGSDPAGEGMLKAGELPGVFQAMISGKPLEQPIISGQEDPMFAIENKIGGSQNDSEEGGFRISGKAEPETLISLVIYSDLPLLATVETDEFGNWKYVFKETLIDGEHEVYAVHYDNGGKITKKSAPLSFFIKEARAVTAKDFVSAVPPSQKPESDRMLGLYMIAAIAAALSAMIFFVVYIIKRKKASIED